MRPLDSVLASIKLPFELAPLQRQDIEALTPLERIAYFYEVGCGKTVASTLSMLMWNNDHNLIVVPPILIDDWCLWLKALGLTDIVAYRTPQRKPEWLHSRFVVMSHAIFRDDYQKILLSMRGSELTLVVDEAQGLKNPASKLFKYVNAMSAGRQIVLLTGTPTTSPADAYSYVKIKTPAVYRSNGHFENVHVADRNIFGQVTEWQNLDLVHTNLMLNAVRRDKKEMFGYNLVPHLKPIPYALEKAHKKLYEKLMDEQLLIYTDGTKIDATTPVKLYHAAQQIIVNYDYFSGDPDKRSAAYDLLDQTLDEVQPMELKNSKLVVWTYYQRSSKAVSDYLLARLGPKAVVVAYGRSDSQEAVRRIMHDPETRVLVGQPGSCGVGLNLQKVCSEMLFLEQSTSPMQARQAFGRVDRVGQTIAPTIRFGQAIGTIQETLFRRLLENDELVQKVERTPKSLREEIFGR